LLRATNGGVTVRDVCVWPIANDIAHRCLENGTFIDAVRLLMPRIYIDANRELPGRPNLSPDTLGETAVADQRLVPVYLHYYDEITRSLQRAIKKYGKENVLYLDMHGFSRQPTNAPTGGYDLILGTSSRSTIRHGEPDRALARFMEERGYRVFLPTEDPAADEPFKAGHSTRWFAQEFDINAIQIEIAKHFRLQKEFTEKGKKLASDIAEFLSQV